MKTILAVVRASTEQQEIESQRAELKEFCNRLGYTDIKWIAVAGASARKANKEYLDMLEYIKSTVISNNIQCVAFWHLDRLGRIESYLMQMKEWFVKNKIQVFVKNPSLKLLNDKGELDAGGNIAWSVFAAMVAYETEALFAKFTRGKERNKKEGKAVAGVNTVPFGYIINENKYIVPDWENTVDIVKLVFTEFATGNYSCQKLADELRSRGVTNRKGKYFIPAVLSKMLKNESYIGKEKNGRSYPPIIDEDLFNKVQSIISNRGKAFKETVRCNLAVKILKCKDCGSNYFANGKYYFCYLGTKNNAKNRGVEMCKATVIKIETMDNLLWDIASKIHITYMSGTSKKNIEEAEKELAIVKTKRIEVYNKIEKLETAKDRAKKMYLALDLTDAQYEKEKARIFLQHLEYSKEINKYDAEITKIEDTINNITNPNKLPLLETIFNSTKEEKRNIIRKHIKAAYVWKDDKYKIIEIVLVDGTKQHYRFQYKNRWNNELERI